MYDFLSQKHANSLRNDNGPSLAKTRTKQVISVRKMLFLVLHDCVSDPMQNRLDSSLPFQCAKLTFAFDTITPRFMQNRKNKQCTNKSSIFNKTFESE